MSAIKFSKQYIKPNPNEVDYWVDLTANPYGGRIKYNNGVDWVDLNVSGNSTVALDNYFTKSQINQMMSEKASVDSVESKVDDNEVSEVIKNIEIKDRSNSGVELVLLKYDNTTIGVTMPIASSTTAGVLTPDEFKDIAKQYQLQELYTELYDKLSEIRSQYQPRLSAGKNIVIDRVTNTIHATGKISTEWEDLINVPDLAMQPDLDAEVQRATNAENVLDGKITSHVTTVETELDLKADKSDTYTKNQIDSKLSGVYRIKGSCLFELLPTDPIVGDTWNILNDFILNDEEHPFGTNVVYTDNGWDALAGIFDSSELEGNIGGVAEALAQETIRAVNAEQANADNINDVRATYLPLTGGTVTGATTFEKRVTVKANSSDVMQIESGTKDAVSIIFSGISGVLGKLYLDGKTGSFNRANLDETNICKIWDSGNDGAGSKLDADMLDGLHASSFTKSYSDIGANALKANALGYTYNTTSHGGATAGGVITVGMSNFGMQLNGNYAGGGLYYRGLNDSVWTDWKQIAFIDSNVASATKLLTPVRLWGLSFNGSSNVYGDLWLITSGSNGTNSDSASLRFNGIYADSTMLVLGPSIKSINAGVYGRKRLSIFLHDADDYTTETEAVSILPDGKVGIGTTTPQYLLDVTGTIHGTNFYTEGQLTSTVTDTAPLVVNSTTKVDNLNADLLDGYDSSAFHNLYGGTEIIASEDNIVDLNDYKTPGTYYCAKTSASVYIKNVPVNHAFTLTVSYTNGEAAYIRLQFKAVSGEVTYSRGFNYQDSGTWSKWVKISDDLDTYNAPTATKLATPVKLWGNTFDGSSDINGDIIVGDDRYYNKQTSGGSAYYFPSSYAGGWSRGTFIYFNNSPLVGSGFYGQAAEFKYAYIGYSHAKTFAVVTAGGNVGIGTTEPLYKLDVNGTAKFNNIIMSKATGISWVDSSDNVINVLDLNASDLLHLGYSTASSGYSTYIHGYDLLFRYGSNRTTGIVLNSSGNVTIGNSDLAGTDYKLYVNGPTKFLTTGNYVAEFSSGDSIGVVALKGNGTYGTRLDIKDKNNEKNAISLDYEGDASFYRNITSGELVDWYGVSWSEDSSDPTCTRIGNMALHRSLPILSAMKGYFIRRADSSCGEMILPYKENWQGLKYSSIDNENETDWSGNVMIKIPEFWYIDDYEPSTKTHNLKISQTAKAGWMHHKEAYVGAYEGYNDETSYRSSKNKIPTVNVTRGALRSLARANGYEGESKWNIYTYEEHRAICHLFLVEYATRNSQLAVNSALTEDGFKQGGLGSGCTTGVVTINGATKYAFIPTGTTDSLGNGSGEVAYTVTQTDADGNETGTVTRYANRYRGIENPFGHIWKHVDDVITQYSADTTYRTAYKCNNPAYFETSKNAKYKPLCSFPGGGEGYLREIKATVNCDFFPMTKTGASTTTYWCDYSYDNTDASEHCLLIGGYSVNGGKAGLFCFLLNNGVSYSAAGLGSRLTYLPWAE